MVVFLRVVGVSEEGNDLVRFGKVYFGDCVESVKGGFKGGV